MLAPLPSKRNVVDVLFKQMLLHPPVEKRLEAVKSLRKIFSNPERIADAGFCWQNQIAAESGPQSGSEIGAKSGSGSQFESESETNILATIFQSLVECSTMPDLEMKLAATVAINSLLTSLKEICESDEFLFFPPPVLNYVNGRYKSLGAASFGPRNRDGNSIDKKKESAEVVELKENVRSNEKIQSDLKVPPVAEDPLLARTVEIQK